MDGGETSGYYYMAWISLGAGFIFPASRVPHMRACSAGHAGVFSVIATLKAGQWWGIEAITRGDDIKLREDCYSGALYHVYAYNVDLLCIARCYADSS